MKQLKYITGLMAIYLLVADNAYPQVTAEDYLTMAKDSYAEGKYSKAKEYLDTYTELSGLRDSVLEENIGLCMWWQIAKITLDAPLRRPQMVQEISVNGVTFEMLSVEGGKFNGRVSRHGDCQRDDSNPTKTVSGEDWIEYGLEVEDFLIGKTEVTQGLWKSVMGETMNDIIANKMENGHPFDVYHDPYSFGIGDDFPVYFIERDDVDRFIRKLNDLTGEKFRLPTEEEWIYAEMGGRCSKKYKYPGSNNLDEVAWHADNSNWSSHIVATKLPNELGIYDLAGNVYEMTQGWLYGNSYWSPPSAFFMQDNWRAVGAFAFVGFRLAMDYNK